MLWCSVLRAVADVAAVTLRPAVACVQPSRWMTFAAPHRGQAKLATPGACYSSAAHLPRNANDFGVIPGSGVQTVDAEARVLSGRISRVRDVAELAALVDTFGREFNYFHITSAITRLPKIMPHVQPNSMSERIVSERVLELARAHVGEMDGVGVATVLWGVGKLGMDHVELLDDLEAVLPVHLHTLNARHVANVWWAYGKLGRRPSEDVGEELLAAVEQNLSGLNPQGVANIAWAMAHLNMEGAREALNLLERRALGLLRKQAPNVGRGRPTMPLSTAFPGFNTHGVGQWAVFNPQEVANLVWAFATLKYRPSEQFLHHALVHATPKLANFQPQEIANLAWGLATLRRHNVSMPPGIDKFLPVLEQQVLRRLPEFKPSEISQVLMAFAVLAPSRALSSAVASAGMSDSSRSASGSMVDAVAHTVASSAHKYNPNDVSNTLYGFARMGHHPGTDVLGRLVKAVGQHNLSRSSDVSLSMILWSCAQLNFSQPAAGLRSILDELRGRDATAPGMIPKPTHAESGGGRESAMEEKAGVATVLSYGSGRGDPPAPRLRALRHPVAPCENEASASCSHIHGLMDTGELLAKSVALGEGDRAGDGGARTLRARVSWRTELFQEVLHRLQRWSLFHRTQARHQEVVVDIIKGASAHELNEMFLYVDCARFWKLCRKSTLDRLRTRLNDLGIPARAALLRGLIKVKKTLQHWWNSWVRDILLETKGEDLTLLKNMVDGGGDYHNLNKLLFKDMALMPQTVSTRKTILKHIQAEGRQIRQARHSNMAARPRVKIVSDIDDTLWSSGGHYPAGVDERLPKQVVYPGALALFREIIHDANSWQHSQRIDNLINSAKTLCVTCDSSTAGSDQSTSTPPPSVSPTTALNIALLPAPAPVTPSVPVLPYVGIQFGSAPSWNAVPELSSPSTTPWGSFDARKLKRVTSEPVLLQSMSGVPEDDEHGTAWCRVPGYFERHPAKYTDTLETVRKKIAHSLLVPERSLGQVHVDFSEMDQNFNTDCSLLFLSARPGIPRTRGMLERMVYGRFKELYGNNQLFTMPTLLPGSLMAGLKAISIQLRESFRSRRPLSLITSAWIPVGFQKMIALRNFAAIYPEYDYVFFGDNGQADAYVCDRLMWEPPMNHTTDVDLDVDDNNGAPHTLPHSRSSLTESSILVAFIHQVHDHHDVTLRSEAIGNRCICETCTRRMSEFTTYIGAAVQAVGHGLLSLRGLYVVGQEASEDFYRLLGASLVRGPFEKWRRTKADQLRCALNRDIQAANALLLDDMQLTPLMRVAEWRSALQPTRTQSPDSSRAGERNILGQAKAYSCAI